MGRSHYLDNLRFITVLLLFPYHTFMIYNNWGESWYIHGASIGTTSYFLDISWGWMMPLLFAIAGISTAYALKRRSIAEYAKERVHKLLIPFVFGALVLIPIQSYIAGLYFNGSANYFDFFMKFTDLTGYDGAFTPGQLWYILYLFVISLVCLPLIVLYQACAKKPFAGKIPLAALIPLGIIPLLTHPVGNIGGKSLGEYAAYFLLGYFILSYEDVQAKLDRYRFLLLGMMIIGMVETLITRHIFQEFFSWINILALLGLARHYLNSGNKLTSYLSKSSFGVYLFHQSWIVVVAYFVLQVTDISAMQMLIIMPASILLTFLTYESCRKVNVLRWMFGLKK